MTEIPATDVRIDAAVLPSGPRSVTSAAGALRAHGVTAWFGKHCIIAGVDMDMVDGSYATLAAAVTDGTLPLSVVDQSVRRVLRAKFALGLFDNPWADEKREQAVLLSREHLDASRRVAD